MQSWRDLELELLSAASDRKWNILGNGHTLHSAGAHSASAAPSSDASAARFRHKFMWEFQDYGLLLGSDMIVFSNAKHPKFSMQLHDVD